MSRRGFGEFLERPRHDSETVHANAKRFGPPPRGTAIIDRGELEDAYGPYGRMLGRRRLGPGREADAAT